MVADATRTEERSGGTCNESEKDDAIGLCRRRRDSTERAGVPQTGRRLSGMQGPVPRARPPFARPASRSGWVPPLPRLFALTPILPPFPFPSPYSRPSVLFVLNPLRVPPLRLRRPPLPSPITARKRKCGRTESGRAERQARLTLARAHVCMRARATRVHVYTRLDVTSSHGNQCSWPPTRSHGAKPTRPASFGHLCERASYLSLALSLFLDLSPASLRDPRRRGARPFLLAAAAATAAAAAVSARVVSFFFSLFF